MAVPNFQSVMRSLLKFGDDGEQHTLTETVERLGQDSPERKS